MYLKSGDLRRELEDTIYSGYPVGELLLGFGFFIVLALEIGIVSYHKKLLIDDISRRPSFDEVDSNDSDFGHSFNSTINGNPILYESNTHQGLYNFIFFDTISNYSENIEIRIKLATELNLSNIFKNITNRFIIVYFVIKVNLWSIMYSRGGILFSLKIKS